MSKVLGTNERQKLLAYPGGSMFELGCHVIDQLVKVVHDHTSSWGTAGEGYFWKPELVCRVAPDGRFEPDPERSVALMNESDKQVMSQGLGAAVIAVGYALDQGWRNAHLLARADSPASGFNPADLDETTWWRNELRAFVEKLGELPIVETSTGRLPGLESELADAHVDFISPRLLEGSGAEDTSVDRMWLLFEQATKLDPPSRTLAADWSRIADGWASLDAEPQRLTVQALAGWVRGTARGGPAASNIAELQVDGDRYAWLARYIDIVGECWQRRSGVETSVLDGMLPNQRGILRSPHQLRIDVDVSDELKDICEAVGLDVRAGLLSTELTSSIESLSLGYATPALAKAVTNVAHENHIINELLAYLIKLLPEDTDCSDENLKAQRGTALFLRYLWKTGGENMSAVAHKVPLVAESKKIVYWSPERVMMAPVSSWGESARAFSAAYPQDRILDNLYTTHDDVVVAALTAWGMAYADPIIKSSPSSLDGERLAKMVLDDFDSAGVIVRGAEFSQIALLPREVINHIQDPEQARALLGLVLMHVAPNDEGWRQRRRVNGFRARENIDVPIGGALWVGDLRSRAWIPIRGEDDKPVAKAGADVSTLRPLLEPSWLDGNDQAIALLTQCFEFDELELRLLGIAPEAQVRVRQGLARLLESGGADPEFYEALARDAESKQLRKRDIERCKRMGYAVQDAIGQALESHGLQVRLVDYGFDFEVTGEVGDETFEDMAVGFPVGPYFVEVKATTSGPVRLTSAQADKAASVATRYVLCVVDLREVPDERLDQEWSGTDVEPLASMLSDIGGRIVGTWDLVQRARDSEVGIRNETALRYEVPPYVWMTGVAISQWIAAISEDPQIRA
jgi:hypothetical protein